MDDAGIDVSHFIICLTVGMTQKHPTTLTETLKAGTRLCTWQVIVERGF